MDHKKLLFIAYGYAKHSPDPSTQNSALLVNNNSEIQAVDINRFPKGVYYTKERWQRPLKYKFIEHAERNVCFRAAQHGIRTSNLTMICPWAPCTDCARCIIQCGLKQLVTHQQAHDRSPEFWQAEIKIALEMMNEAGIPVIFYDGVIGAKDLLHSGNLWNP